MKLGKYRNGRPPKITRLYFSRFFKVKHELYILNLLILILYLIEVFIVLDVPSIHLVLSFKYLAFVY